MIPPEDVPRALVLTLDFLPKPGGVQNHLAEIGARLAHAWTVVAPSAPDAVATDRSLPYEVRRVPRLNAWTSLQTLRTLRPSVVLCGHTHPQLMAPAWLYARTTGKRWGVFAHGNDVLAAQRRWHRPLFNALLAHADFLLPNSTYTLQRLVALGVPAERAVVIRPGVDPQRFRPATEDIAVPGRILTVGRLVPRKGHRRVIQILPEVCARCPDAHYMIVGDGEECQALRALSVELRLGKAVQFVGTVERDDLVTHYQRCQIFVMPSQSDSAGTTVEGFGIVFLEASGCAKPVIGTRSGGVAEAVRDGVTGLLVPPDDLGALGSALIRLLTDAALRRELGMAGRSWVEREMNWDRAASQVADVLVGRSR